MEYLHESQDEMESLPLDDGPSQPSVSGSGVMDRRSSESTVNSILDPPSYADAIFMSFDSSYSGNGHRSPRFGSKSDSDGGSEFLKVWVSEPRKEHELANGLVPGGTTFYTYLITTSTNMPEYGGPGSEFSVQRRFKDVVTLSDRLTKSYKGYFVPVRPDKGVVESQMMQMEHFVEQRRVALDRYLKRLTAHPVIRKSKELRDFLVVQGRLQLANSLDRSSEVMGQTEVAVQPPKAGRDLLRMFKELRQSVVNDWGRVKPMVVEEDTDFLEKKEWLLEYEQHLSNLSVQAESLVKAQQDIGDTMGDLGLTLVKLTKFETEEAVLDSQRVRATDMKNVATAAVKASRLYGELNTQTVKHLDKLHDYLGIMLAANIAFSDRSSALLTVQTLSAELASLQSRIEQLETASSKIFGGDKSRMLKIEELNKTVRVTEDAKSCAVREYERIKENNKTELERLDIERHNDFMGMVRGFVLNQAGYAEKMANAWEELARETSGYIKDGS
ncbi:sorting nexin 2B-like [Humulus lupulus]|uniref:sorting nexin 2B-like n=1 Tax=Humulus lupulus TaxID=3486 RepID=UPI002B415F90|nr:sorting nexin 2B-like [Humulus lupulus]